jgi:hypothetical protein
MRCLIALPLLCCCAALAQTDTYWAIPIQAPAVAIRANADTISTVLVRVSEEDALLVRDVDSAWVWAQYRDGRQGYMPRTIVRPLTTLPDTTAARWMRMTFAEQERLGRLINERYLAGDKIGTQLAGHDLNDHEYAHNAALSLLTPYFCRTGDITLLRAMMVSIAANVGSASEEPPYRLTLALECRPAEFKRTLASLESDDRGVVVEATSNGIWLRFDEKDPDEVRQREALLKVLRE